MNCKLEHVNDYVCSQVCFEQLWTTGDFQEIGGLCENRTAAEVSFSHRDRLLLKMTLIQRIFQKLADTQYNCANLWKICEALVTECSLLEDLINCLESNDQLIAFSACKSLVKVVVGLPLSSSKTGWFKENLFNFDKCQLQAQQHTWRLVYTMEFLRQIMRFCHSNQDTFTVQTGPGVKMCNCGAPKQNCSVSKCALISMILACDRWVHTLPLYIPFWNDPWRVSLQECETQDLGAKLCIYSNVIYAIHHKTLPPSGLNENVFVSFLMFLLEVVRYFQKTEKQEEGRKYAAMPYNYSNFSGSEQQHQAGNSFSAKSEDAPKDQQRLITNEIQMLLKVVPALIFLLHLPSLSATSFKSVLNVLWQVFMPLEVMSPHKDVAKSQLYVLQSSAALISGVDCCLLKNIPQTTGVIGFGGQEWRSLGDQNPPKADPVCLRKLSLLLLKASHAVLEHGMGEPAYAVFSTIMSWSSNLKHLVLGAVEQETSKTCSPQHCSEEDLSLDLLIRLFSDQDDELIEVLLILLRIYQKVQSFTGEQLNQHWNSFIRLFNPHDLFVSLLESVCFDHTVLLDFLISPETCFLSYLLSYLRFMLGNWRLFFFSIKHYEEVKHLNDERDSPKLLSTFQDSVEEENERRCASLYSLRLSLSLENADGFKVEDLCRKESSTLKSKPTVTGDSATEGCGQMRHVELGCLQDIARAYKSEDSSEESEEDEAFLTQMDTSSSALFMSSCEKSIEEADMRAITVKIGSHYLDRFDYEPNTDIPAADCVSISRCEQFTLEDTDRGVQMVSEREAKRTADSKGSDLPDVMGRLMAVLIRLRLSSERLHRGGLFPYNAEPLLRSMRTVERLYDGC